MLQVTAKSWNPWGVRSHCNQVSTVTANSLNSQPQVSSNQVSTVTANSWIPNLRSHNYLSARPTKTRQPWQKMVRAIELSCWEEKTVKFTSSPPEVCLKSHKGLKKGHKGSAKWSYRVLLAELEGQTTQGYREVDMCSKIGGTPWSLRLFPMKMISMDLHKRCIMAFDCLIAKIAQN